MMFAVTLVSVFVAISTGVYFWGRFRRFRAANFSRAHASAALVKKPEPANILTIKKSILSDIESSHDEIFGSGNKSPEDERALRDAIKNQIIIPSSIEDLLSLVSKYINAPRPRNSNLGVTQPNGRLTTLCARISESMLHDAASAHLQLLRQKLFELKIGKGSNSKRVFVLYLLILKTAADYWNNISTDEEVHDVFASTNSDVVLAETIIFIGGILRPHIVKKYKNSLSTYYEVKEQQMTAEEITRRLERSIEDLDDKAAIERGLDLIRDTIAGATGWTIEEILKARLRTYAKYEDREYENMKLLFPQGWLIKEFSWLITSTIGKQAICDPENHSRDARVLELRSKTENCMHKVWPGIYETYKNIVKQYPMN
jgi:hypothetical protein